MKKHDENKDLRAFARIGRVDYSNQTLQCSKSAIIGIHMWGKIDYLTHYCGWYFVYNNSVGVGISNIDSDSKKNNKEAKRASKEHKLTDKTKRKK